MVHETTKENRPVLLLPCMAVALACGAALLLATAGLGSRFGWWHFLTGFTLLRYGAYGGMIAALLAVAGVIVSGRSRQPAGVLVAATALIIGITATAIPVSWRLRAQGVPPIHDISTDTVNPPPFVAIIPLRRDAPNTAEYGGPLLAAEQKKGYPDLHTEVLDLPATSAFDKAMATAKSMGWQLVAADPALGRIEASERTFWFGFTDDIVVRIVAAGDRSLVDVRSVSRVGKSDAGTNARRIREYLKRLRN